MMRILYHHRTLAEGAEGVHIQEMVAAFRALGHEVLVAALVGDESTARSKKRRWWSGVSRIIPDHVYELAELIYNVANKRALLRAMRSFQPHFVYDRYNTYSTAAVEAGQRLAIPVLLEVNSPLALERIMYDRHRLRFPRLAQHYESRICNAADHVFAVSTPLRDFLVRHRSVPESKITVLVNGANPVKFAPGLPGTAIRERFGLGQRTVIGFVGCLRPWHGFDLLLEAFSSIVRERLDVHLLVVGDGPLDGELRERVRHLQIQDRVTFAGGVDYSVVQEYLAAMNIGVTARATFYASPMKILEYMAMALPTVAPRMPNICDILEDGKEGLLFRPDDPESLAAALRELSQNPELARQLGAAARRKVETELNWRNNAARVLERAERLRESRPIARTPGPRTPGVLQEPGSKP